MRITRFAALVAGPAIALGTLTACASSSSSSPASPSSEPSFSWATAPGTLPPGAELAVLEGDPSKSAPFTIRLRFPNGYRIPPHTHPTDEHVTVMSGTFLVGMGRVFKEAEMTAVPAGGFVTAPAGHAHYALARGVTVVQVHAVGPFAINYVNAADAPSVAGR